MKRKLAVFVSLLSLCVFFVPSQASAALAPPRPRDASTPPLAGGELFTLTDSGQPGRGKRLKSRGLHRGWTQGRHKGWYKGRRAYWYTYNPRDSRYVREVYYVNRRPLTRWIWYY